MMAAKNLRELMLALALFFNPLGYNEVFAFTMSLTRSYWIAASAFYCLTGVFFVVYLILRNHDKTSKK